MPCEHNQSVSTHGKCNICGAQLHPSEALETRAVSRLVSKDAAALAEMKEVLNHDKSNDTR